MPQTPDRFPGAAQEEQTVYEDNGVDPSALGGITFNNGAFRMWDALGVFNPRSGASTIFGEAYTSAVSEAQSDTTLTAFQNKVTLTTGAVNAGTYLVMLYCEARTSAANKQMQVRVRIDGVAANVLPADYLIEITDSTLYKTIDQLFDEVDDANEFATGGFTGPRGFTRGRRIFTFRYETVRTLYSSLGMQMRISLENDIACGGERATAVFYCVSGVDPGAEKAMEALLQGG